MKYDFGKLERFLESKGVLPSEIDEYIKPLRGLNNTVRYGIVWEEPNEDTYDKDNKIEVLKNNFAFLKENGDMKISNDKMNTNLLIEGDNFHALNALRYTHYNKIDFIYIDPPYNTGKEFVYNDKIVDAEHKWKHSKWLSFMHERLQIAKELMSDEGVIFISIDDNEHCNLKLLCDKVFGNNFIADCFVLDNLKGKSNDDFITSVGHKMLVYAKNIQSLIAIGGFNKVENVLGQTFEKQYKNEDKKGVYKEIAFQKSGQDRLRTDRPYSYYPILVKNDKISMITDEEYFQIYNEETKSFNDDFVAELKTKYSDLGFEFILPENTKNEIVRWTYGFEGLKKLIHSDGIVYRKGTFYTKKYAEENELLQTYANGVCKSLFYKKGYANGTQDLEKVLPYIKFDFPKPIQLIKDLLLLYPKKDFTVLDFFAGSGTTGQAVIELNAEDGGNRKFILCTNNEIETSKEVEFLVSKGLITEKPSDKQKKELKVWLDSFEELKSSDIYKDIAKTKEYMDLGICRFVTYPRISTVINGKRNDGSKYSDGLPANLNYYVVDLIENKKDERLNNFNLIDKCTDLIAIKENCFLGKEKGEVNNNGKILPYELIFGKNKVVLLLEKYPVYEDDIEIVLNVLSNRTEDVKCIYSSYIGVIEGYNYNLLPQEVIEALEYKEEI